MLLGQMEQKWQMHQTSAIALAAVKLFRLQQRLSLLLLSRECHAGHHGGHTADVSLKETNLQRQNGAGRQVGWHGTVQVLLPLLRCANS